MFGLDTLPKKTRKEVLPDEMNLVVPSAALPELILPMPDVRSRRWAVDRRSPSKPCCASNACNCCVGSTYAFRKPTLASSPATCWGFAAYANAGEAALGTVVAGGAVHKCGSSRCRSAFFSVGSRSNTSLR